MNTALASPDTLTRFLLSLIGSELATKVKISSSGLFVSDLELEQLISAYQIWLKADSGGAGLLDRNRCLEHLFGTANPSDYYILDGKHCLVGYLVKVAPTPELKAKIPVYSGSPIDGRYNIHPKDPILAQLPMGVQIQTGSDGMELHVKLKTITLRLPLSRVAEISNLVSNSPRLRKHRHTFRKPLRKLIGDLAHFLNQARPTKIQNIKIIPAQLRRRSNISLLTLADLVFVVDLQGKFLFGFGLKARNLADFLHQEIRDLTNSVRSKRIGDFDLRHADKRIAGLLHCKTERFALEHRALMDFVQIWRPSAASKSLAAASKSQSSPATLFDMVRELSSEFAKSGWTLDKDISPRFRGHTKDNLNYRTTKGWVFWIARRSHIVSLRRRPIVVVKNPEIVPNVTQP